MNVSKAPNTNVATNNQDSRTKAQKAVPAALLKQLRATAALLSYDHLFGQPTMSSTSFQRKLYNMYHGHEDLNIVSQLELMYQGQGRYSEMFYKVHTINTSNNVEIATDNDDAIRNHLALSPVLLNYDNHIRYVCGEHFTIDMLRCPTKTLTKELCTGRYLLDLSKQAVANIKKAAILADQWLVNNQKPSGTCWDDLYKFLIENSDKINSKEKVFTGMAAFLCCSKYNDGETNHLNILAKNEDEAVTATDASRSQSRISSKKEKDKVRAIGGNNSSIFNSRGLSIDSKMQMVEIAQFEDAQARDDIKNDLEVLTNRNKLLLTEREQEITLAKLICPEYDKNNSNWKRVMELGKEISEINNEMAIIHKKKSMAQENQVGKSMAAKFLATVRGSEEVEHYAKHSNKRSLNSISDSTNDATDSESPMKKTITVTEDDCNSASSLNSGTRSSSDPESSVSVGNNN